MKARRDRVVLHVDADTSVLEDIDVALAQFGVASVQKKLLSEARSYLRECDRLPDVILLDLCLPDSCGVATLIAVVHEARGRPVIVYAGDGVDEEDAETIQRGTMAYIRKGTVGVEWIAELLSKTASGVDVPRAVERTDSEVIEMVGRVRHVMEG